MKARILYALTAALVSAFVDQADAWAQTPASPKKVQTQKAPAVTPATPTAPQKAGPLEPTVSPPSARLEIREAQILPATVTAGGTAQLRVTVANTSPSPAGPFAVGVLHGGRDVGLLTWQGLPAGGTQAQDLKLALPQTPGPTCYELRLRSPIGGKIILGQPKQVCVTLVAAIPTRTTQSGAAQQPSLEPPPAQPTTPASPAKKSAARERAQSRPAEVQIEKMPNLVDPIPPVGTKTGRPDSKNIQGPQKVPGSGVKDGPQAESSQPSWSLWPQFTRLYEPGAVTLKWNLSGLSVLKDGKYEPLQATGIYFVSGVHPQSGSCANGPSGNPALSLKPTLVGETTVNLNLWQQGVRYTFKGCVWNDPGGWTGYETHVAVVEYMMLPDMTITDFYFKEGAYLYYKIKNVGVGYSYSSDTRDYRHKVSVRYADGGTEEWTESGGIPTLAPSAETEQKIDRPIATQRREGQTVHVSPILGITICTGANRYENERSNNCLYKPAARLFPDLTITAGQLDVRSIKGSGSADNTASVTVQNIGVTAVTYYAVKVFVADRRENSRWVGRTYSKPVYGKLDPGERKSVVIEVEPIRARWGDSTCCSVRAWVDEGLDNNPTNDSKVLPINWVKN